MLSIAHRPELYAFLDFRVNMNVRQSSKTIDFKSIGRILSDPSRRINQGKVAGTLRVPSAFFYFMATAHGVQSSRHTPCAVRLFLRRGYGTRSVPATLPTAWACRFKKD